MVAIHYLPINSVRNLSDLGFIYAWPNCFDGFDVGLSLNIDNIVTFRIWLLESLSKEEWSDRRIFADWDTLTHLIPLVSFYSTWKENLWFSNTFRGYSKRPEVWWNGLTEQFLANIFSMLGNHLPELANIGQDSK